MKTDDLNIEQLRVLSGKWLTYFSLVFAALTTAGGWFLATHSIWPGVFSLGFAAMVYLGHRFGSAFGRQLIGLGVTGLAMAFVSAWSGTGWQIDAHFAFLAFLALLIGLNDVKVILVATVAIVVHHLGFGLVFQSLVFPSSDLLENILRAVFHAVMVIILDAALIFAILSRHRMEREMQDALARASEQAALAQKSQAATEEALEQARAREAEAQQAQTKAQSLVEELKDAEVARDAADEAARAAAAQVEKERAAQIEEQTQIVDTLRLALARLADRDFSRPLTTPLPAAYETLRTDYNQALEQLNNSLHAVTTQAVDLRSQIATINSSASDVSKRSEDQVVSMERTATAISGLNETVEKSASDAQQTAKTANSIEAEAGEGHALVREAGDAMLEIQKSSNEIAKINALIDGIAFQTNLLALNAGVEAARAGEAGRGFAVVASEVRALSLRTTEAANDIGELVSRSQEQVANGAELVSKAGRRLTGIVGDIADMTQSMQTVAASTQHQSESLAEISTTLNELDKTTQGNAALFEETSAACDILDQGMDRMTEAVSSFRLVRAPENAYAARKQAG